MEAIQTHPQNATQAKTFIAPGSLSFPGGAGDLTPPSSEADRQNGQRNGAGGQQQGAQPNGNGVTPATPAATPGATQGVSGIVPTLQYVYPLRLIVCS
jgi:transcription initiation factor TFIID TATA-box-binding protein